MFGEPGIVKTTPLLGVPETFTTTGPVIAPSGTVTLMLVELQPATPADTPLNVTTLLPCDAPKSVPEIVTGVPAAPSGGIRANMAGTLATVKLPGLLGTPPTVTITFPVVAPVGTVAVMLVSDQLVTVNAVPFNVAVLLP